MSENRIMSVMLKRETSSATVSDPVALVSVLESPMLITNLWGERNNRLQQGGTGSTGGLLGRPLTASAWALCPWAAATGQASG